jgi:glycerophosphoryl diester phosphodiesterase
VRTAYLDHAGPIPLAHRGFSRDGLENSMAAFAAAVDLGMRYVETDVHATLDGVVVAFHDESLDRVTDRTGRITALRWREVSSARIGGAEPVPMLEDLLGTWPELRVNIDIKSPGAITPTVRVIERTQAHDRVCIASFSDERRRSTLLRLSRPVVTSAGRRTGALFRLAATAPPSVRVPLVARALAGVDGLQLPVTHQGIPLVTRQTVDAAHAAGAFVHVWTINDRSEMHRLLDLGVDGLVSDRSDLLREVLVERGQWSG